MNFKEDKDKGAWILELGTYPGICLGMRTYAESEQTTYVQQEGRKGRLPINNRSDDG